MVMTQPDLDIGPHWLLNAAERALVAAAPDGAILVHLQLNSFFGTNLSFVPLLFTGSSINWPATLAQEFIPLLCDMPFFNYTSTLHAWVPQGEEPSPNTVSEDELDSALPHSQHLWNVANTIADSIHNTRSLSPNGQLRPLGDNITLPIERTNVSTTTYDNNMTDSDSNDDDSDDDTPDLPRTIMAGSYVPITVSGPVVPGRDATIL